MAAVVTLSVDLPDDEDLKEDLEDGLEELKKLAKKSLSTTCMWPQR